MGWIDSNGGILKRSRPAERSEAFAPSDAGRMPVRYPPSPPGGRSNGIDNAVCVRVVPVAHKSMYVVGSHRAASSSLATPNQSGTMLRTRPRKFVLGAVAGLAMAAGVALPGTA